jgi:hypothetical protein
MGQLDSTCTAPPVVQVRALVRTQASQLIRRAPAPHGADEVAAEQHLGQVVARAVALHHRGVAVQVAFESKLWNQVFSLHMFIG